MKRRDFLKGMAGLSVLAVGSSTDSFGLTPAPQGGKPLPADRQARVSLAGVSRGASEETLKAAVRESALEATDFSWLSKGDSLFIKPALNSGIPYPSTTSPLAIAAMVGLLRERGAGRVIVGDMCGIEHVKLSPDGLSGSSRRLMEASGMAKASRAAGAELHFFEEAGWDAFYEDPMASGAHWRRGLMMPNILKEVDHIILEAGEQAAFDAGVSGLHPEVMRMLGRLKYRTSYGQNQLTHAVEVAKLATVIAAELGADVEVSKAAGLLHDLGKAMDHNMEGTHALLGAEFAKRYGVNPQVVNAIGSHHHEIEQESVEAAIAEAADAISGARPGARRESLEQYIQRVRALEDLANSFKGVSQSFALQAGREVRIFVKPEEIDDLDSIRLARDIAKNIEESMRYPGQIKVTVIRETRAIDYAK